MKIYRPNIILLLLLVISFSISAQGIKRNTISFYGSTSNNLKLTAGQITSGFYQNSQNNVVTGFQQPLKFNVDASLSLKFDTILCTNEKLILKAGKCFNYQWFRNDTLILNHNVDSLIVEKEGSYKLVGSDGITKFDTSKKVKVSYQLKTSAPIINTWYKDTLLCFYDSVRLSASAGFDKYLWSTGDTSQSISVFQSGQYYLRVREKGNVCYSEPSVKITMIKNSNTIPAIVRVGDDLISSNANNYRWYQNNIRQFQDTSNTFRIKARGIYQVATSRDKQCWSLSKEYLVQFDPITQSQNEIQLSAFPNPSNGLFFTQIKLKKNYSGFVNMIISDLSASQTWTIKRYLFNDSQIRIPINMNLKKGSYTLSVNINGYRKKSIQFLIL